MHKSHQDIRAREAYILRAWFEENVCQKSKSSWFWGLLSEKITCFWSRREIFYKLKFDLVLTRARLWSVAIFSKYCASLIAYWRIIQVILVKFGGQGQCAHTSNVILFDNPNFMDILNRPLLEIWLANLSDQSNSRNTFRGAFPSYIQYRKILSRKKYLK